MYPSEKYVLYVDDEPQALKYFQQFFGDRFKILTAISAAAALELFDQRADEIAVLITDQRMPGTTGVQLMEQIRSRHPNIVRVLTTAHTHLESAIQAVNEGGAFRYLTKPWNEDDMIGTLLRAGEYHAAMEDRDRLLQEKLSVLHRLIVMDRVRGLATAATALDGRIRRAWPALVEYMRQSPVNERVRLQMDEIAEMNMLTIARHEAEQMVSTVEMLLADSVKQSTGKEDGIDVGELVQQFVQSTQRSLAEDDLELSVSGSNQVTRIASDRGMVTRLLQMMVRRVADVQENPGQVVIELQDASDGIQLTVRGQFARLNDEQVASFFAAAIPLQKWPIGLDMDLLSCFMNAYHLGGSLTVDVANHAGPALTATLPREIPAETETVRDSAWFDTVYESLQQWQQEVLA